MTKYDMAEVCEKAADYIQDAEYDCPDDGYKADMTIPASLRAIAFALRQEQDGGKNADSGS